MGERRIHQGSDGAESWDRGVKTYLTEVILTGMVVLTE